MISKYADNYYDHFSKRNSKIPPVFRKEENYMMRFCAPLSHFTFDNNNLTIIYFKDGVGELLCTDRRVKVEANKFIAINPSIGWEYVNEKKQYIDVLSMVICDSFKKQFDHYISASQRKLLDDPFQIVTEQTYFMEQTFGADYYRSGNLLQVVHTLSNNGDYRFTSAEELCMEVLQAIYQDQHRGYDLASHIEAKKSSTKLETLKRLLVANDYIQDNLMNPISLDDISRVSALSNYHLYNSFKKIYGKTPHQYINRLKMAKAKIYVQESHFSLSEISDILGYNDPTVFGKVFKKAYGRPPSYYRT
ncbi:AraC family transcriptional regulator [Flagellimonas sp. HMM57]|uniref:helix-turn-helix domain-containing protein n=1 Tax=unclassified Flagellimonas TaxID=2644544 RepID=UPI0013D5A743|nr:MULTISPECIES: AraC family transcriptional regulator [unclassified Flagellimonas]UII77373.1 AraC family transcriptional regulator [Flagellimonas sp. HMM57]